MHRRGKKHTNADALSRLPCRQCGRDTHDALVHASVATATLQPPQDDANEALTSMKVPWEGIWEPTRRSLVSRNGFTGQDTTMTSVTGVGTAALALPARAPLPRPAHP